MTEKERKATIEMFMAYNTNFAVQDKVKICEIKSKFIVDFGTDVTKNTEYVLRLLETASNEKNAEDLEHTLTIAHVFELVSNVYFDILIKLIESDWHFVHEDIASVFQKLKLPETVDSLYKIALSRFEYLEYDDTFALAVKCIWALGGIKTESSKEKLRMLAQSDNEIIRDNALRQLKMF